MEIWTIKIECVHGRYLEEASAKICEIPNMHDLDDLCYFILDSFGFDDDHLHEFFVARNPFGGNRLAIEEENLTLNEIMPLERRHHLFMHFDFGDDWIFKISRSRQNAAFKNDLPYPRVIEHIGKNPDQYPMDDE